MTERIFAVARKELIQLRRDPRSLTLAFGLPVLLVLLFGYTVSFDVKDIRLAILDEDRSSASRELIDAFRETKVFRDLGAISRRRDADRLLTKGYAQIVIVIPEGFAADAALGRGGQIQALVDGADANTASISVSYAEAVVGSWGQRVAARGTADPGGVGGIRAWYNETLDSRLAIVPGLIAVVMMVIAAMLTSLTIAREWERGTMEQLASTPVHPLEVIGGKLLPYLAIGLIDMAMTVFLGLFVFQVPFRGSLLLLFVTSLLFLLGGLGLGIFISALVKSQLVDPDEYAHHLSARLPALRLRVRHRQHAAGPAGREPAGPSPLLHRGDEGNLPEGSGPRGTVAAGSRPDAFRARRPHARGADLP
jgi:ABC-2 type transport system permease protein